ncbi:MAG: hypothetical protein IKJ31_07760, partial [Bacteroidaceae bacterium]|nr:hypothetical protein [Bacteroidaceae bacterium]
FGVCGTRSLSRFLRLSNAQTVLNLFQIFIYHKLSLLRCRCFKDYLLRDKVIWWFAELFIAEVI